MPHNLGHKATNKVYVTCFSDLAKHFLTISPSKALLSSTDKL